MQVEKMSYDELQWEILNNDEIYRLVNEKKFLSGLYTHSELIEFLKNYIFSGSEALSTQHQTV